MRASLSLHGLSGLQKLAEAARFLPHAWQVIEQRRLRPPSSYFIRWQTGVLLGLSDGELAFPAARDDFAELCSLIVRLEDRRFFSHRGVDARGILRAVVRNMAALRIVQGGSTITQQLVRNTLLQPDRSWLRKGLEVLLACKLERHYTKSEILDLYCRSVFLGPGIRGFSAAARVIYRRPLSALGRDELYGLAGLLRTPSSTFPAQGIARYQARQAAIARMLAPLPTGPSASSSPRPVRLRGLQQPRISQAIGAELEAQGLSPAEVRDVTTTCDPSVQEALDHAIQVGTQDENIRRIAGVVVGNRDGRVLAEAAWALGDRSEFSPTYRGRLQPGSTFKPFAMLAAMEQGFPCDLILESSPFESTHLAMAGSTPWKVRNFAETYRGAIAMRDALVLSDNTAFARLAEMLDLQAFGDLLRRFGLSATSKVHASMVLGAHPEGVSLLQVALAYAALANNGLYSGGHSVGVAVLNDGRLWFRRGPQPRLVVRDASHLSSLHVALVNAAGPLARWGFAGKSGTTRTGTLFAGYTRELSVVLWGDYKTAPNEKGQKGLTAMQVAARFARRLWDAGPALSI